MKMRRGFRRIGYERLRLTSLVFKHFPSLSKPRIQDSVAGLPHIDHGRSSKNTDGCRDEVVNIAGKPPCRKKDCAQNPGQALGVLPPSARPNRFVHFASFTNKSKLFFDVNTMLTKSIEKLI